MSASPRKHRAPQRRSLANDFGLLKSDFADTFAPESPSEWKKNPNEWLSSIDIMKVMKQYEKAYPCFDFIGRSPIDFDTRQLYGECVWEELCNFHLEKMIKKGKTKKKNFSSNLSRI